MKYEKIEEGTSLDLPLHEFIDRCLAWIDEFNNGELIKVDDAADCPLQTWIVYNSANCGQELLPNTAECPICGKPCCPECYNHSVVQISRVTGYLGAVEGWNASKKQEFKDRNRTTHF